MVDASKTLGLENLKVAVPDDPSRARVNLISGITFSSRPRMNWISAEAYRDDVVVVGMELEGDDDRGERVDVKALTTAEEENDSATGARTTSERRRLMVLYY